MKFSYSGRCFCVVRHQTIVTAITVGDIDSFVYCIPPFLEWWLDVFVFQVIRFLLDLFGPIRVSYGCRGLFYLSLRTWRFHPDGPILFRQNRGGIDRIVFWLFETCNRQDSLYLWTVATLIRRGCSTGCPWIFKRDCNVICRWMNAERWQTVIEWIFLLNFIVDVRTHVLYKSQIIKCWFAFLASTLLLPSVDVLILVNLWFSMHFLVTFRWLPSAIM